MNSYWITFAILMALLYVTYIVFTLILLKSWNEIPVFERLSSLANEPKVLITVIIPVRNEEAHIGDLLEDLCRQSYREFEVIVVNDQSTDATATIVEAYSASGRLNLKMISLTDEVKKSHKKAAIKMAIEASFGALITTTDGDCRVGEHWLASIHAFYQQHQPKLISAGVTFHEQRNWFDQVQTVEFLSLIGAGAASMHLGIPNMCNGANLTYERTAFEEVGGFAGKDHIASGDDEFLMHKIHHRYPNGGVKFLKSAEAAVKTLAQPTFTAFYQQRKRWASKWDKYDNWQAIAVAVFVYSVHLLTVCILCFNLLMPQSVQVLALGLVLLKFIVEYPYLRSILVFYGQLKSISYIWLTALLHSPYIVWIGMAGKVGGYEWKGRAG